MSYLLDRKIRKGKILRIAGGLFLLAILFYFRTGIFRGLSYAAQEIFRPILVLENSLGEKLKTAGAYFVSKKDLVQENEKLKEEISKSQYQMSNYRTILAENESLKKILSRAPQNKKFVLAAILGKPNQSAYDTLLLDAGAADGVTEGDMVFALGNVPLGRTASVSPNTAKVVLYSSPGEKTQVVIPAALSQGGATDVFWQVTGRGGGNFEMILPRDFVLEKGDEAVLPGITAYTLAVVETILSDPRDPWKVALLKSPVNIQDIKFVEVEVN